MDAQKFGAFIAQCRKEKGMTQSDLAAKIMVTDKAVSRCHRGGQGHLKRQDLKRQENSAVLVWRGAASAGLVSSADRAYMKAPSLVLRSNLWTKCPEVVTTLPEK